MNGNLLTKLVMIVAMATTGLVGSAVAAEAGVRCAEPRVRKEIRELLRGELRNLTQAMAALHEMKLPNGLSQHEEFTKVHHEYAQFAHEVPQFLAWHRHFIRQYELALQSVNPKVNLPYWDWALDGQHPHRSIVFTEDYMGGNGNPAKDHCVNTGPFAGWHMSYPHPHCLRRSFNLGTKVSPLSYPEEISLYLNKPTFSKFSLLFEEKHGYPHVFIGGSVGDFRPTYSPNNPIFFLHHAFIDYVWFHWQKRHPNAVQFEGTSYTNYHQPTALSDTLTPYTNVTIGSLLDTRDEYYCYTYAGAAYPRFIHPKQVSLRQQNQVRAAIKDNIILSRVLQNSTMAEALTYLNDHFGPTTTTAPEMGFSQGEEENVKLRTPGVLTEDWAMVLEFLMPDKVRANSQDSVNLAQLLNRVPHFKSLAHFSRYLGP